MSTKRLDPRLAVRLLDANSKHASSPQATTIITLDVLVSILACDGIKGSVEVEANALLLLEGHVLLVLRLTNVTLLYWVLLAKCLDR